MIISQKQNYFEKERTKRTPLAALECDIHDRIKGSKVRRIDVKGTERSAKDFKVKSLSTEGFTVTSLRLESMKAWAAFESWTEAQHDIQQDIRTGKASEVNRWKDQNIYWIWCYSAIVKLFCQRKRTLLLNIKSTAGFLDDHLEMLTIERKWFRIQNGFQQVEV